MIGSIPILGANKMNLIMENKDKLKHVSFAGIDSNTDREELRRIQDEFPIVEFGVLMSRNWFENGNRYMSPSDIERFRGLNLCAHLCGKIARDFMKGDTSLLDGTYPYWKTMFKRIQVNVAPYGFSDGIDWSGEQEVYIQCKPNLYDNYENSRGVGMLIDNSGGRGIEEEWIVYPTKEKIGYAGGLNPSNVVAKTASLINNDSVGDFWIDMESGVRDEDDWFSIEKVRAVLNNLKENGLV